MTNGAAPEHDFGYFDAKEAMRRYELGRRYGLDSMTFFRLARMANNACGMGLSAGELAILPDGAPGCCLTLFGNRHMHSIFVRGPAGRALTSIVADRLDENFPGRISLITAASDDDLGWSRALHAVCAAEMIGYGDFSGSGGSMGPDEP
jgi:hypothetical protein